MEFNSLAPRTWRPLDDVVSLSFHPSDPDARPSCLGWRGSLWHVVGSGLHWSTWRFLPVRSSRADEEPSTCSVRTDFWRFQAQVGPGSPVLSFEVRGTGREWRLVRLAAMFELPGG
ncbi:hypothetical protein FDK12_09580 [Arthrobacter sp. NamB2]|uniref:hypothetical protein n=1 Tax=Arthrobacter sp. NamB2 TaxID=2576035 RepID=UPI0010C9401F|nr:hypothetical protein [Arthrobacter sp. NamB2]TKV28206.1 hypothetical protein FDK12_09580 [Arthrobacter sp. NamB2]